MTPRGTLTTLYSFCTQPGCADGDRPNGGLVQAPDGNFYGTTYSGGANNNSGTVFKITPGGTLTTLYNFCSQPNCSDGESPFVGLVQGSDGNFYGTTGGGGVNGYGTVFRITTGGTLTTIYSFDGFNGLRTDTGLVQAADGNFYGTTLTGGNPYNCGGQGCGTVFKITPAGKFTTLYIFNVYDGAFPYPG